MSRPVDPAARARVIGAVGRVGEALINALMARTDYTEVAVLADQPVNLGIARLAVCQKEEMPAARDLYMVLGGDEFATRRSFHGRDAPFVGVDESNGVALAGLAVEAGVKRIVLVAAAPSWQQIGALNQGLASSLERGISELAITRFAILRPLREARSSGVGVMQRFVNFYLSIQMLMVPRSVPVLTSDQVARAAILAMAEPSAQSVAVFSAADIGRLLSPKA